MATRGPGKPFQKGQSGNPKGKPKGATNLVTRAVRDLMEGEAEALSRKAVEMAMAGDTTAMKLCLERIAPAMKDAPISFDLPPMETVQDAAKAMQAILRAVAAGEITPAEGAVVSGLVENFRRLVETADLAKRIEALENTQ